HAVNLFIDKNRDLVLSTYQELYKVKNYELEYLKTLATRNNYLSQNTILGNPHYVVVNGPGYKQTIYVKDSVIYYDMPSQIVLKFSALSDSVFSINTNNGATLYNINNY